MLRKIYLLLLFVNIFLWCGEANSYSRSRKAEFNGAYLTGLNLYQLGAYEFVLKLYGKNLPEPSADFYENSMSLTLENLQVKNINNIKSATENVSKTIPLITDFNIENFSDNHVSITLKANSPLKIDSARHSSDGYILRIKISEEFDKFYVKNIVLPPPKQTISPKSTLPFAVSTKITLELRDAELSDVLRMLMTQIGRNIIIDPSFPKNILITMSINDERIDEVLNYLLRTYGIACYTAGKNTLAFGTRDELYKLSGANLIKSFRISYANINAASTMLKNLASLKDSEITLDERMRTIYINTNPAKMEEVEELISIIDVPARQIMIHASIFEFYDESALDVENVLQIVYDEWTKFDIYPRGGINYKYDELIREKSSGISRTITGALTALEQKNKGKILANPSVIAIDGQEAAIKLTQDLIYISGRDEAGNPTTKTEEVGPQLTFTPHIETDGYIRLKIHIQTGEIIALTSSGNSANLPTTSNRDVKTEVRVREGMPFVVGGLYQEYKLNSVARIPILGNIPLLGELFTYRSKENKKTQAIMIVTPYIIK